MIIRVAARLAWVSLILFACGAQAAPPTMSTAELAQQLSARFAGDRSGACVLAAVMAQGQVVRASSCAGTRQDGPPDLDAAFEIGSVTKTMTAFLVADLVERGLWSLDDPIAKHLPAGTPVPRQGERQILVRDLLTHSSGLPALPPRMQPTNPADPYASLSEQAVLASLAEVQLTRPIGSQAEYSNFGMMLVSLAVARSCDQDYEACLRERLFKPLGMDGAFITRPAAGGPQARGHLPTGDATVAWTIPTNLAGAGMVKARLADMERYALASLGTGPAALVATLRRTHAPLAHGFAMNWMHRRLQGRDLLLHEGGTGGFSSFLGLDPAGQRAVVLLADASLTDLGGLGDLGLSLLGLSQPVQAPRRQVPAPAALKLALAGEYALGGLPLRIWLADDGHLMAQAQGQGAFELLHDSRGDFYPTGFSALLSPVWPAEAGAPVRRFAWHQGGGVVEAQRLGHEPPPATAAGRAAWQDWFGEYALAPQFAIRVFENDGQLMVQGTGQAAIAANVAGRDRIEISQVGAVIEFERNAAGHVTAAVLRQGGQTLRGLRR